MIEIIRKLILLALMLISLSMLGAGGYYLYLLVKQFLAQGAG